MSKTYQTMIIDEGIQQKLEKMFAEKCDNSWIAGDKCNFTFEMFVGEMFEKLFKEMK